MRPFTVVYAITRRDTSECYHHVAHVNAEHNLAAEARCNADTLPGYAYSTMLVFDGHLSPVSIGHPILFHSLSSIDHNADLPDKV